MGWRMTCYACLRMFGVLKKIFRKPSRPVPATDVAASSPVPTTEESRAAVSQTETRSQSASHNTTHIAKGDQLAISYASILRHMPQEFHGKNQPGSSAKFSIDVNRVVEQLAHGAVRVSLKELRRAAPVGIFVNHHTHDEKMIDLPLKDIVPQLKAEHLSRRQQKRLEAPDDGTELFNRAGQPAAPLRVLSKDELLKAEPAKEQVELVKTAPAAPRPQPAAPIAFPAPTAKAAPRIPAPNIPAPSIPATATNLPNQEESLVVPLAQLAQQWPAALRDKVSSWGSNLNCLLPLPLLGTALKSGAVRFAWRELRGWIQPAPPSDDGIPADTVMDLSLKVIAPLYMAKCRGAAQQRKMEVADHIPDVFSKQGLAAQGPPEEEEEDLPVADASEARPVLSVSLSLISQKWPDALRKEIALLRLTDGKVEIPLETIEAALKAGRFECHWKQICHWLKPCPTAALASVHADMRVELPMNMIAPLYLKQRPAAEQPAGDSEAVAAPEETTGQRDLSQARTLSELFNEPDKRNWTPNEIVHKTSQLPGVAGALMALQDGLLVASCMPPEWKSETIAAFLPQIFGRMKQYSKELKMGELESISFSVEQGAFQIFNVGIIYFAVLAKPTSNLPKESLKLIVRELARHTR